MLKLIGTPIRKLMTFTLVAFMMFAGLLTPASTLAQSQTIQSSLTGVTITYAAPYVLQEDGRFLDDSMETMMFLGAADVLAMGFMSPLIDLNGARDILLESLFGETGSAATIDRGDYSGVSYSLDMLNIDGMEMGVFSLFMNQRSHGFSEFYIFLAPPAFFGTAMQTAQNSFTINGGPLMDGVDAIAMGNMVTANIGITGGSAVTDVTDVTDNTSETTSTTQTDTTQTDTGESADGDRLAYLLEIGFEFAAVDDSLTNIWKALNDLGEQKITAQEARTIIDEAQNFLRGTNDRVAQIVVPTSMQDFHQETLAWSNAVTNSGVTWFAALDGTATQEQSLEALNNATETHLAFGERLAEENILVTSGSDTTSTAETTTTETDSTGSSDTGSSRSTRSTGSTQSTTTSSTDASGYIEAVQEHRAGFVVSLTNWTESFASLGDNPTDAQLQQVRGETLAEAEYWITFSADAQQLTPPAGYEDVHAAYVNWAAEVTELGNLWIGGMNGNQADLDAFSPHLQVVADADANLDSAIRGAGQQSGDTSTTSTSETSGTTEAETGSGSSETSSRTTRSTGSGTSDNTSETTGNTSRTTRSTGNSTTDNTSETSGSTSRTSRTTGSNDSGNTSETRGSTTSTAANEWFMEATGVTIVWSDDFSVSTTAENAQTSDLDAGDDRIVLVTTTPNGVNVGFSVTAYVNDGTDSTAVVAGLVDVPAAVTTVYGEGAQVLEYEITPEQSAALIRTEDEIGPYYVYVQVTCLTDACDIVALLSIPSEGIPLLDTLDAIDAGVSIDGASISTAMPRIYVEETVDEYGN